MILHQRWFVFQEVTPTPRTDRINKDYEKDHPAVEIEARKVLNKEKKKEKKNIENVKLDTEVSPRARRWQISSFYMKSGRSHLSS